MPQEESSETRAATAEKWSFFLAVLVFNAGRQAFTEWTFQGPPPKNPAPEKTDEHEIWNYGFDYEYQKYRVKELEVEK
jgi:hypothetical protein